MGYVDIAIILIFWGFIFWGLLKGFLLQFLSLLAVFFSLFLAVTFHGQLAAKLRLVASAGLNRALFFFLIFAVPILIFSILIHFLNKAVKNSPLSFFNRIMGGVFGAVKAFFFCAVLIYIVAVSFGKSDLFQGSRFVPVIMSGAGMILDLLPGDHGKDAVRENKNEPAQSSGIGEAV